MTASSKNYEKISRRETIEIHENEFRRNVWVIRDADTNEVLEWSCYRNDLRCSYPDVTFVE